MGLQLPARTGAARRRLSLLALSSLGLVLLTGCSGEGERLGMPDPVTEQGEHTLDLWQGAWIAALLTGALVWGLIFYAVWRFRRRSDDEVPIQTRYNLPLEIFYTIFPVIMVVVFFSHTVSVQNKLTDLDGEADNQVTVVGQQWSWTFNYPHESDEGSWVFEAGTAAHIPTLVIPVGETTEFTLVSPDVIHDFGVPGFLMKMDVIPGQENHFRVTPTRTGTFAGKCFELCGVSHSRMLFNVRIVQPDEFEEYLDERVEDGWTSENALEGGEFARQQEGLENQEESE